MRILVFSDSHLTDKFEEKKYLFLKNLIQQSDRVIINGDFWDGQLTTFSEFINSDWKKLFPLLKNRKAVYLYGNHDLKKFSDNRTKLFSNLQDDFYRLKIDGKNYIFEHGNRILPMIDEILPRWVCKYTTIIAGFFLVNFPPLKFILKKAGQKMKNIVKKRYKNGEIVVCGHSHWADFDPGNQYVNTGYIENGNAQYLIIENGKFIPKKDKYI